MLKTFCATSMVLFLLNTASAAASQGMFGIEPVVLNEAVSVRHPDIQRNGTAIIYVPRFGVDLVYGLLNHMDFSAGIELSLNREIVLDDIIQGVSSGSLYATYRSITVPWKMAYRLTVGGANFIAALTVGFDFSSWQENYVLPSDGSDGVPLYIEENPQWHTRGFGRLSVGAEWQPAEWCTLTAMPYFAYSSSRDIGAGLFMGADFTFPFGGFWDPA